MLSGLLPPGLNESYIDTSSGDEETLEGPVPILKKETEQKDFRRAQTSDFKTASAMADEIQEFQKCPSGISLDMWNKFQNLQQKNLEMKVQTNQKERGQKRERSTKVKLKTDNKEESQQSANESQLRELTQYFGINARFELLASKEGTLKSGLEISIDKAVADRDIAQADELSDRLATREETYFSGVWLGLDYYS
uniref:Uncharacterized protein n=1 Tax=Sphaerodactylus townsendi TaxID=933632 RepID=A0ACB8F8X5_9SAUR